MESSQQRATPNLMAATSATATTTNLPATFMGQSSYDEDKINLSRRSVDWRDSGIVIDEDQKFNSFSETISENFNQSSLANSTIGCCPLERIASDQDDDGDTILHLAVVGCAANKVRDLIKICDLNAINNMMQTPLHVATMANRPEMVELLLRAGAKLEVHDRRGNTPLLLACQKGLKEIAIIILETIRQNGVATAQPLSELSLSIKKHLETTNFDGQTCLHSAAAYNQRNIVELLVNTYDADLNCRDSRSGKTILHKAISEFNVSLVEFILGLAKHCNIADYAGRTPSDTINLLRESKIDKIQFDNLNIIDQMVDNRIRICIEQGGCCKLSPVSSTDPSRGNEILGSSASSTSSSDYSDSDDSDMS